jgi:hypothetical protein
MASSTLLFAPWSGPAVKCRVGDDARSLTNAFVVHVRSPPFRRKFKGEDGRVKSIGQLGGRVSTCDIRFIVGGEFAKGGCGVGGSGSSGNF